MEPEGCFNRLRDEDEGIGGDSTENGEELASERKAMRELVRKAASDHFELAQLYQQRRQRHL